jgi:hypothetical protein
VVVLGGVARGGQLGFGVFLRNRLGHRLSFLNLMSALQLHLSSRNLVSRPEVYIRVGQRPDDDWNVLEEIVEDGASRREIAGSSETNMGDGTRQRRRSRKKGCGERTSKSRSNRKRQSVLDSRRTADGRNARMKRPSYIWNPGCSELRGCDELTSEPGDKVAGVIEEFLDL